MSGQQPSVALAMRENSSVGALAIPLEEERETEEPPSSQALVKGVGGDNDRLPVSLVGMTPLSQNFVIMCAEPGMGKTYHANMALKEALARGMVTHRYSLDGLASEDSYRRLMRISRELCGRSEDGMTPELVIIDGLASPDEYEATNEAKGLLKLAGAGYRIIVCMRPEAEQLAERLPQATCYRAPDLLLRIPDTDVEGWRLTGGIPLLLAALRVDRRAARQEMGPGPRYAAALADLVQLSLREGMPDEETRNRLGIMLLGKGTMEELGLVSGRCDYEQLSWFQRDVPLLGADALGRSFCCHGLQDDEMLEQCLSSLQRPCAAYQNQVIRCCGILATRGEAWRSALLCRLLSSEQSLATVGVAWGVLYASVGDLNLVAQALKAAASLKIPCGVRHILSQAAVHALAGTARQVDVSREKMATLRLGTSMEQRLYHRVRLLCACRDCWRHPRLAERCLDAEADDLTGMACLDHMRITRMMAEGNFAEAYATISNEMLIKAVRSVPEALLCEDLYLCLALSGGVPDARERGIFLRRRRFFARMPAGRLQIYHAAAELLPRVLMGAVPDTMALEDAAAQAERVGDRFWQAVCLWGCAVSDVRARALSRAHVRARRASELAHLCDERHLASACDLVDALALELMGGTGEFCRYCARQDNPEDLALVGRIAALATGELPAEEAEPIPLGTPCPRNALWAVYLFACDCVTLRDEVVGVIPPSWLELVRLIRARQAGFLDSDGAAAVGWTPKDDESTSATLDRGEQAELWMEGEQQLSQQGHIQVSLLGGFGVKVDGRPLTLSRFERRHARDLMALLALVPGHRIRRYKAVEIIYPDADYYRGPRRLYEATGEARKLLTEFLAGANPIVSDRMQGTIGFDLSLVSCDIDDFEREAHMTLAEDGDDFWVLDHAREMERLYGSGPDERLKMLGDAVAARTEELRGLFVDASVAAGEAALRLGKTKLAVRYAMGAHCINDLREDVMILLVRALRAAGRGFEVAPLYKQFSRHLIEVEGVPPSLALRRAVELALDDEIGERDKQ